MSAPSMVKFLTNHFPGETKKILEFSLKEWKEVLMVNYPYVSYASMRTPLLFVDPELIDRCCPRKYCFSPRLLGQIRKALKEISEEEVLDRIDWIISEEARKTPEKYWNFVSLACYCSRIGIPPLRERLDYVGPAILICLSRLEERVNSLKEKGVEDPILEILKAIYCHEVVHSYIDAWSSPNSPSRASISRNKIADEFYHAFLEESIATALEVKTLSRERYLEKAYASYLLKVLPAEYLGFYSILSRIEGLEIDPRSLGDLPEAYSSEESSPPLWSLSLDFLLPGMEKAERRLLERSLMRRLKDLPLYDVLYLIRRLRDFYGKTSGDLRRNPSVIWKIAALSWMSRVPLNFRRKGENLFPDSFCLSNKIFTC